LIQKYMGHLIEKRFKNSSYYDVRAGISNFLLGQEWSSMGTFDEISEAILNPEASVPLRWFVLRLGRLFNWAKV